MNEVLNALFTQQRLQILTLAVHHGEYSDAYLYAWYAGVYPFFEDTDGSVMRRPHEHYKEQFRISEDKVDELSLYLDQCEQNDEIPTFYELEDHYQTRHSQSEWSRSDLLKICRYFFLRNMWDEDFWKKVLEPMKYPSEAASIVRKFDRKNDVYFE
ncbi:hypothetical protein ACSZNB_04035 [Aeromonas hydrophila]